MDPPLPPPAIESENLPRLAQSVEKYTIECFGNEATSAPNPALVPNDPNIYHPPGPTSLSTRKTFKKLYRKAGDEEKGHRESRSEVKEVKKKAKVEKVQDRRERALEVKEAKQKAKAEKSK